MVIAIVLLACGALSLTTFLIEKIRKYSVKETLIKAFTSLLFIALAAYSWFQMGVVRTFPFYAIVGLALGMLGDIWLELKYVFKEQDKIFTYAGFACFAIGHLFYMAGLFKEFYNGENILYIILPFVGGLVMGLVVLLMEKPLKLQYGKFKWVCFAYGVILFSMTFTTLSIAILYRFQSAPLIMLFAGGLLFAVSDLILSGTYFGQGKDKPFDLISNAVTYYAAQYLIAFSIFFL